jgi:hypothetical protein
VWDLSAGKEIYTLSMLPGQRVRLAFSTEGRYLAAAVGNHAVKTRNASSGEELPATFSEKASGEFSFGRDVNGLRVSDRARSSGAATFPGNLFG